MTGIRQEATKNQSEASEREQGTPRQPPSHPDMARSCIDQAKTGWNGQGERAIRATAATLCGQHKQRFSSRRSGITGEKHRQMVLKHTSSPKEAMRDRHDAGSSREQGLRAKRNGPWPVGI